MIYEENVPPDIELSVIESTIQTCFPDVKSPEVRFLYHGTHNVYEVRGRFIFRFPSTFLPAKERIRLVRRETEILNGLQDHIAIRIPSPLFVEVDSETPYMGYQKIPGCSLTRHYSDLSIEQRQNIAKQVGVFLGELHELELAAVSPGTEDSSFDIEADRREWSKFYERVVEITYPNLSHAQKLWTDTLFHDFLDHDENFQFEPVLVHGDFDTSNILVDPETFEVTGIIDFEETRIYDPAADFLFQREGSEFMTPLLKTYPKEIDGRLQQRMSFRYGRIPFVYVLSGLDLGIDEMVRFGYRLLDERVRKWDLYSSVLRETFSALLR